MSFGVKCCAAVFLVFPLSFLPIVTGIVETGGSAAGTVTGIRTETAGGLGPVIGVVGPAPARETERETGQALWHLERMKAAEAAAVEIEKGNVGAPQEVTAGAGRGVGTETGRDGAGAETERETGREAKGWMGRRLPRETLPWRGWTGCLRSMKERKWVRAWRSAAEIETGTGTETESVGAATGTGTETETGVGETERETGSIRESVETGRGEEGSAEKSATLLYEMTWARRMTWAMGMMEIQDHPWTSTARTG